MIQAPNRAGTQIAVIERVGNALCFLLDAFPTTNYTYCRFRKFFDSWLSFSIFVRFCRKVPCWPPIIKDPIWRIRIRLLFLAGFTISFVIMMTVLHSWVLMIQYIEYYLSVYLWRFLHVVRMKWMRYIDCNRHILMNGN